MKVFYHSDLDGEASAASFRFGRDVDDGEAYFPINYNTHFPIDDIEKDEEVFIFDFTLQEEGMWDRLLSKTENVTWVDHHERAIRSAGERLSSLPGLRAWTKNGAPVAACELCWEYFHPGEFMPLAIYLIGDYDCWRFNLGNRSRWFVRGLLATRDTRPASPFWENVIECSELEATKHMIDQTCEIGRMIVEKSDISNEQALSEWGFEIEIEGLRGLCINRSQAGSDFFKSMADGYDVLVPIVFDGERWTVSLYASPGKTDVDLSEIASRFGGSGHRGASGFQCKELPFKIVGRLS